MIEKDLTLIQAAAILRGAFLPLDCGVSDTPFDSGLKAKVRNGNEALLDMADIRPAVACYSKELRDYIGHARAELKARGYVMDAWTFTVPEA